MFQQKLQNIKEQQKKYLIDNSEYHYLIEALLFKLQKTTQGEIEYVSNGINKIDIYIVKDKNIKEIRLPYFDKNFQIWKKKLYTIDELKKSKPKQIIDQYTIKIHEVEELNNQNTKELKALKQQIELLQQENQKLKLINEQIQEENQKLKSINEQIQQENQKLKSINEQIQEENINALIENNYVVTASIYNNTILYDDPIIFELDNQEYHFTFDQIIGQNFNLKINNNNIEIKPYFQPNNITYENNNIYYNLVYSKQYINYVVIAPEPFNQELTFQLIDGAQYHVIKKQNYNVYIRITLQ